MPSFAYELKGPLGKLAYRDSGPVPNKSNYTTVVMIHGMAWHSASFAPSLSTATAHSSRLIVPNRRDFPSSEPFTASELAQLSSVLQSTPEEGQKILLAFFKDRAKELVDFVVALIKQEGLPEKDDQGSGGIVLAGWSLGVWLLFVFLKDVAELSEGCDVKLEKYISRAILYDPPNLTLGVANPSDPYGPLFDDSLPLEARGPAFNTWLGSYFDHDPSLPDGLERRKALTHPPPSPAAVDPNLLAEYQASALLAPGKSEDLHLRTGLVAGMGEVAREQVLFAGVDDEGAKGYFNKLPIRYLLCDRSIWQMPWLAWKLAEHIEDNKAKGRETREVTIKTLEGQNHFVHYDAPDVLIEAMLAKD